MTPEERMFQANKEKNNEILRLSCENFKLQRENEHLIIKLNAEHIVRQNVESENTKLREYATKLETVNIDITARLSDYIGQYDPTDAYVAEVKAQNIELHDTIEKCMILLTDHDFLHWPELFKETTEQVKKLGIEVKS